MGAVREMPLIRCPSCGAGDVRESYSHNPLDAILGMFGMVAYRCRACRGRFHKRPPREGSEEQIDEPDQEPESEESGKHSDKDSE
jgi:hypothetical protein